jgi:hypothetical protein
MIYYVTEPCYNENSQLMLKYIFKFIYYNFGLKIIEKLSIDLLSNNKMKKKIWFRCYLFILLSLRHYFFV